MSDQGLATWRAAHQEVLVGRRARVVERFNNGGGVFEIALDEKVSTRTVYRDLNAAGIIVSRIRCVRDGARARLPKVRVDGRDYLLCPSCKRTLAPMTGVSA